MSRKFQCKGSFEALPYFRLFLGVLGMLIGCTGCGQVPTVYRPLTLQEVQSYAAEHGITPIAIKELSNGTLIAFDTTGKSIGLCSLAKDQQGKLTELCSRSDDQGINETNQQDSLIVSVMSRTTGEPHTAVIIHDAQAAARTDTVTITLRDGQQIVEQTQGQRGVIITDPQIAAGIRMVTLSTASGETVYEQSTP